MRGQTLSPATTRLLLIRPPFVRWWFVRRECDKRLDFSFAPGPSLRLPTSLLRGKSLERISGALKGSVLVNLRAARHENFLPSVLFILIQNIIPLGCHHRYFVRSATVSVWQSVLEGAFAVIRETSLASEVHSLHAWSCFLSWPFLVPLQRADANRSSAS